MTKITKHYNSLNSAGAHGKLIMTSGQKVLVTYSSQGFKVYQLYLLGIFPRLVWWSNNASRLEEMIPELKNIKIGVNPIEPFMEKLKSFNSVEEIQLEL